MKLEQTTTGVGGGGGGEGGGYVRQSAFLGRDYTGETVRAAVITIQEERGSIFCSGDCRHDNQ